ncbi:MAG TPA: chromosome segregation protein SMC, partial [Dehalococcoidia bacterium]|nr:chromosome segregation protein SMC [Dehalococcoidia bacterium]
INKSKVRLRDVVDLFLRAQVGQNSYAFMGQGLVDEVLHMRPEERRRLLEEAADVRLLRTRLDEARDRLLATKENLERVNLLLDEIGPRLKQLERQASRAAEHSRLAGELAQTLRELYVRIWQDAQEALTASRAALDQKSQELVVSQSEAKATEEGLTALTSAVEERQRELNERRSRLRTLSDQVHQLEQRMAFDGERIEGQTRRRAEIETEIESLRNERADIQAEIAQAQERELSIKPEIEDARSLIETRRQEMNSLEQEHAGLRRRVAEGEEKLERVRRSLQESETAIARIADDENRAQNEGSRRANRRRELVDELMVLGRDYLTMQQSLTALEREIAESDDERHGLEAMIESSRASAQALERETMQLEANVTQLRGRESMLLTLQSAIDGVDSGARFLLGDEEPTSTHNNTIEGLIGLVQDIVRVPPGLERAIEAALAENVQALVFENLPSALAAIDMLEQREAGRAIIYPVDAIKTSPPLNLLREKGVIGVAARLVRCENRFRTLVDALLGRVIVVESVSLAQQVLRRGLGSVVTMDGVLLKPNGSLAGGVTRAAVESFTRQRELEELPEQIRQVEARGRDAEARLLRERESLAGYSDALSLIEPKLHALREERSRRQNALLENRGKLILLRSEARSLQADLRRGDDGTDWRARRQRLSADRDRFEAEAREIAETLEHDREAVAAIVPHRSSAIDAVSEAAAAHADLEGEARSLAKQTEMLRANLGRSEERLRAREQSLTAIDAEMADLRGRGDTGSVDLARAREELAAMQAEMEPAEGELSHLEGRVRSMRDQLSTARSRLLDAERSHIEAEASVKLRSDELDALRETIVGEGFRIDGHRVLAVETGAGATQASGRLPPIGGGAEVTVDALRSSVTRLRQEIRSLGPVNEQAAVDYDESKERYDFLKGQVDDLEGSEQTLQEAIGELESNIRERLKKTFEVVDREFSRYFEAFFNGGKANLSLTQPDDYANTGIDIVAQPPGKRVNTLAMLSGGERTLTALALLLSLLEAHPSPICVLDEVDAALDETNVGRFVEALRALEKKTQFIIITHNPRTIEAADSIYGVSMGSDNTSRILSLRLDDMKN